MYLPVNANDEQGDIEMVRSRTLPGREAVLTLRPLIDTVADPAARVRQPAEWEVALSLLRAYMQDPAQWQVFVPQRGCAGTYALINIGKGRLAWLQEFCRDELGYEPPRIRGNGGRKR